MRLCTGRTENRIWGADETSIRRFGVHPADDAVIRAGRAGNP